MDLETLYPLVTDAIRRAEVLEDLRAPGAIAANLDLSLIEERIAELLPASSPEGAVARRGAIRAALAAQDFSRAQILTKRFAKEPGLTAKLKAELRRLGQEATRATQEKPGPSPNPWLEARAEIYLFTSRIIAHAIPAPGRCGTPHTHQPASGSPPFGFGDDDLRGKWVYIDPRRISAVPNENAVLFPVVLDPDDSSRRKEVWVKAGLEDVRREDEAVKERERKSDLEKPKEQRQRKAEDAHGRIRIDEDLVAAIKTSPADVARGCYEMTFTIRVRLSPVRVHNSMRREKRV